MIDYSKTKAGDKLRITGIGAPGFAKLGDIVTVTSCNGMNRCDVVNEAGESAYFALTCGAQRLEPVTQEFRCPAHVSDPSYGCAECARIHLDNACVESNRRIAQIRSDAEEFDHPDEIINKADLLFLLDEIDRLRSVVRPRPVESNS